MKSLFILVIACIVLFVPSQAHAIERVAGHSAVLAGTAEDTTEKTLKVTAIKNVLTRYGSPMQDEANNFVTVAEAMQLEPYMLPAIAGVESGFGNALIQGSHNPFGWNVGRTRFATWSDGIATVGYALRTKYINRGATSLEAIGHRYAGGSPTWAPKVIAFMQKFEKEEARLRRYSVL